MSHKRRRKVEEVKPPEPQPEEKEEVKSKRKFKPKNKHQAEYIKLIKENDVTLCIGPAGTGKTACAIAVAVEKFIRGEINKIIITRPTVENGKGLGFLPGGMDEKYGPYVRPVFEEIKTYFGRDITERFIREEIIWFLPLEYVRGLTFKYSAVILDESQNTTIEQLKMFLTRIGEGSIMVLNGDLEQDDMKTNKTGMSGFADVYDMLRDLDGVGRMEFLKGDVLRHPIIPDILDRFEGY